MEQNNYVQYVVTVMIVLIVMSIKYRHDWNYIDGYNSRNCNDSKYLSKTRHVHVN